MGDDKKKGLERSISDSNTVIEESKEGIATLAEEAKALKAGIVALDKQVSEATVQRKAEEAEHKELMQSNTAAKELILFAKNRLNKFYNPKLAKAASFAQLSMQKGAPPPPPATAAAYKKKAEGSNSVISMMDLLVQDLDKEMTVSETEEKNGQAEYEETIADASEKRRQDSKSLTDKEAAKADLEGALEKSGADKKSATKDLMGTEKYIASLHGECDWLLKYHEVRQVARADEVDALGKAKAVLNGADYSLLQRSHSHVTTAGSPKAKTLAKKEAPTPKNPGPDYVKISEEKAATAKKTTKKAGTKPTSTQEDYVKIAETNEAKANTAAKKEAKSPKNGGLVKDSGAKKTTAQVRAKPASKQENYANIAETNKAKAKTAAKKEAKSPKNGGLVKDSGAKKTTAQVRAKPASKQENYANIA